MADEQSQFQIIILDAWEETGADAQQPHWRFRLRHVRNGQQHTFATVEALLDFLHAHFEAAHTDTED